MTLKRDLNIIYCISFMDLFAVGLTVPLLSNHLRDLGASHFQIGLLTSLYSGIQVISGPVVGSWSDVRDRKSVLIVTLLLSGIAYLLLGITNSLLVITFSRIVLGLSKHTQSLCKAVLTDLLPVKERSGAFGKSTAFSSFGFIIGPTLGGHLSELNHGFFYVCVLTSFLFIINIVLTTQIKENVTRKEKLNLTHNYSNFSSELLKSFKELKEINWNHFWDIFLIRFIFGFSVTMYLTQQSTFLREEFNLSQRYIGYIISYYSTTGMISAYFLNYITKYFYPNDESCFKRLSHFFVLMTLSLVCLHLAPNVQLFLIILIPFSICCTVLRIVSMELMLKEDTNNHRGSLSAASNSVMSVARFVTPVTSGLITDRIGEHYIFLFLAIPPLIGTVMSFRMKSNYHKKLKNK